jgi:O-antigen/teichoic acid export membrane protein
MLVRQTLLYLPAQVLGPLFQFVSILAWTHVLKPVDMGVFALVVATQELAYVATTFWFTLSTMRYYDPAGPDADRRSFLDTEMFVLGAASAATILVVLLLPAATDVPWSPDLALATIAYAVTRGLVTHLADRARTEHDTLTYSVLQISWPVLGLVAGLALVAWRAADAANVLWGYAAAQAFSLIVAFARLEFGRRPFRFCRATIAQGVSYGLPLLIGGIFVWLANNGLRFVVEIKETAAAVGLITVGWGLGLRVAAFAAMLVTAAAFPVAMKRAREEGMDAGQAQLERNGVLLLAILAPAAAGLAAVGAPFVTLVVAEEFRAITIEVLPFAILAGAFRNFRIHFAEQVFLLHERTSVPLWNDAIDAVLSLAGVAIGLWYAGLPGAVAGAAAGAAISLAITLATGWLGYRFGFPFDALWRIAFATLAMMTAVWVVPVTPSPWSLSAAVLLGGAVYVAGLAAVYPDLVRKLMRTLLGWPERATA